MKKIFLLICICIVLLSGGCSLQCEKDTIAGVPDTLADLAYTNGSAYGNRVYLIENDRQTPYLVLSDDYNGHCLLLREFLLSEERPYNDPEQYYASYYDESWIDQYLNDDFYKLLSDYVASKVIDTPVVITAKESLEYSRDYVSTIERKVFLLSYAELNFTMFRCCVKEGEQLTYFDDWRKRIAYFEDGQAGGWWLRTPDTTDRNLVYAVDFEGAVGAGGIISIGGPCYTGARPAFCLPGELPISQSELDGELVFVFSAESDAG